METQYQEVFDFYNTLAGLSFSPRSPTDKNPPNRYFMKPDSSGGGFAYYAHRYTAASSATSALWIGVDASDFMVLHEIGHGYQGQFINHGPLRNLIDVWNDIYSHYFQELHFGEEILKRGFMYNREPEKFFNDFEKLLEDNQPASSWRIDHHRLFYLVSIFDKAEKSAFIDFNKTYRKLSSESGFQAANHPLPDLIADSCARVANIDISPFLTLGQTPLSEKQETISRYLNGKPVYPLYKLVQKEQLNDILKTLQLSSRLALVDAHTLKPFALTGTLELKLEEKLFKEIANQEMILKDGTNLSIIVPITTPTITLEELPIGIYTLQPPSSIDCKLNITTRHLKITADTTNQVDISYYHRSGTALATQRIELNGYYGNFASVEVNQEQHYMLIDINSKEPHILYADKIFTSISIKDRTQKLIFQKKLRGDNTTPSIDKIPFDPAYTLEIFHEEPDRNNISPYSPSVIDPTNKLHIFELTRQGLKNSNLDTPVESNLEIEIEKMANSLRNEPTIFLHKHHPGRDNISLAIDTFPPAKKAQLEEKYQDLYLSHQNKNPRIVTGSTFTWHQYGLNSNAVIEIEFNLALETITVNVSSIVPHNYFKTIYMSIWIHNESGNTILCQELRGDTLTEPFLRTLPFKEGSQISVLHLEPTRAPIINLETAERYQVMQRHCVRALGQNRLQI
ncbi:putative mucin/carbohydrate-binding domain-containing protein [Pseudomonas sp. 18173]|uniref:putative mucin/carbohydrate-binding domain-containing protein n=1 Tax=Pseudomonas sp. 18173 TaxID=3390055 RepID=UPI003D228678